MSKKEFITKDSGERDEFDTGSRRDTREGKGRFDLITPFALKRLAELYERGAEKYGNRNWEKGQPISRTFDSMVRHANDYALGDRSEDHITAVAWNAFMIVHTLEMIEKGILPKEFDDMPTYEKSG